MIKLWCRTCKNLTKQILNFEFIKNLPNTQAGTYDDDDDEGIDSKEILLKHSKKKIERRKEGRKNDIIRYN